MKIIINNCYSNVQISASINHRFSQSSVSFRESLYEYDKKKVVVLYTPDRFLLTPQRKSYILLDLKDVFVFRVPSLDFYSDVVLSTSISDSRTCKRR